MSNQDAYIGTLIDATAEVIEAIIRGGPGSGHHGHRGRPGEVGGSLPDGAPAPLEEGQARLKRTGEVVWKRICGRCGGSGKFAFNLYYGDVCFGCNGRGWVVQKKKPKPEDIFKGKPERKPPTPPPPQTFEEGPREATLSASLFRKLREEEPDRIIVPAWEWHEDVQKWYPNRKYDENRPPQWIREGLDAAWREPIPETDDYDAIKEHTRQQDLKIRERIDIYAGNTKGSMEGWTDAKGNPVPFAALEALDKEISARLDSNRQVSDFQNSLATFWSERGYLTEKQIAALLRERSMATRGGPGSGHHGHKGRPGEVGGSLPAEAGTAESWEAHLLDRYGEADYQNATWIGPSGKLLGPGGDHQAHAFELLGIRQDLFTSEGRKEGMRATNEVVKGGLIRLNIFRSKVHMGSKEVYFDTPDFDKLTDEQKTTMAVVITQVARESGKVIGAVINEGGVMGRGEDKTIFDEEAYEFLGLAWHDPLARRGGPGSGHHGHEGRPGEVGGSLPSGAVSVSRPKGDWISAAEKNLESDELDVTNLAGAGFVISPTGRVFGRIGNASLFGYHWQLAQLSIKDHRDEIEASLPERDYDDYGSYDDMDLSGWGLGFIRGYITQRTNELSLYVMTVPNRSQTRTIKDIYEFNDIVSFHWEQDLDPTPDPDKLEYATYNLSGDVRDFNKSFAKFRYFLGLTIRGGPGSGHHGHRGRPGKVGGSLPSDAVGDNLSDLLKVPQTPLWDSINRALQNIDSVHGVYPMRPLRVFRSKATRRRGSYHAIIGPDGDLVPDKLGVVLDKGGEDRTLTRSITLAHEIAHYLDHDMFGRNRYFTTEDMIDGDAETGDDYATLNMISTNLEEARAFQKWWSAIKSSDAYEEMQNFDTGFRYMDSDGNLIRGFPPPDQMTTKIYQYTPQMLRSWRQPNEFFARSYAQWIATRSGDPVMINELNDEREFTRLGGAPTQWEDDDFEMIAGAFDELFDSLGLLR